VDPPLEIYHVVYGTGSVGKTHRRAKCATTRALKIVQTVMEKDITQQTTSQFPVKVAEDGALLSAGHVLTGMAMTPMT